MKKLYNLLLSRFHSFSEKNDSIIISEKNFFDYSSSEKIKLMRAAGRDAQKEQQQLINNYKLKFE